MKPVIKLMFAAAALGLAISFSPPVFANDPPDDLINSDSKSKPKAKKTVTKKPAKKPTKKPAKKKTAEEEAADRINDLRNAEFKAKEKAKALAVCKKFRERLKLARNAASLASEAEQIQIKLLQRAETDIKLAKGEQKVWSDKKASTEKSLKAATKAGDKAKVQQLTTRIAGYDARLDKIAHKISAATRNRDGIKRAKDKATKMREKTDMLLRKAIDDELKYCSRDLLQ